jgi:hypothetical protein
LILRVSVPGKSEKRDVEADTDEDNVFKVPRNCNFMHFVFDFIAFALVSADWTYRITLHACVYVVVLQLGQQCIAVKGFLLSEKSRYNHTYEHVDDKL